MSRTGITYAEVYKAAKEVKSSGQVITIDRVRRILGDRGSNTTISKHLKTIRDGGKMIKHSKYKEGFNDAIGMMINKLNALRNQITWWFIIGI